MSESAPISVIIPHYNRSEFIRNALDSIRRQTLPPAEIIIVDDASHPKHRAALRENARGARVIQLETNAGAAQARNIAIGAAREEFLAFLDDDDEWLPEKLQRQFEAIRREPALEAVAGPMTVQYENGSEGLLRSHSPEIITLRAALAGTPAMLQTLLIRTSAMRRIGALDPRFRIMHDHEFWIRFAATGAKARYMHEPLARLNRLDMERLTRNLNRYVAEQLEIVEKHRALYEQAYGESGPRRQRAEIICRSGLQRGGIVGRLTYLRGCMMGGDWGRLARLVTVGKMADIPFLA